MANRLEFKHDCVQPKSSFPLFPQSVSPANERQQRVLFTLLSCRTVFVITAGDVHFSAASMPLWQARVREGGLPIPGGQRNTIV